MRSRRITAMGVVLLGAMGLSGFSQAETIKEQALRKKAEAEARARALQGEAAQQAARKENAGTKRKETVQKAAVSTSTAEERDFWSNIKDSQVAADFQAYLESYPKGKFAALARARANKYGNAPDQQASGSGSAPGTVFKDCNGCPSMAVVPAGRFKMGSTSTNWLDDDEGPQHEVTIPRAFAVGQYEVTFAEWEACAADGGCSGYRPADEGWGRGLRPVINVSWEDAQRYVQWLSRKTGKTYRLLSEAEWEYVARAGTTTPFWTGNCVNTSQANYNGNYDYNDCGAKTGTYLMQTLPVGSFAPNAFGVYDTIGNVSEWVQDCGHDSYSGAPVDGSAWASGTCNTRALRGGSWNDTPNGARAANRRFDWPSTRLRINGFRVARML